MAYHFPTPPMTNCLKSIRVPKRLGRALEMAQLVQAERDNNRSQSVPSGDGPSRRRKAPTTKKSQRSLDEDDMFNALVKLQSRSEEIFGKKQI